METNIYRHQNTVVQYIVTRPILDICLEAVKRPVFWVPKRWWGQEGLIIVIQQESDKEELGEERNG